MCFGSKKEQEENDEGARRNREIEKALQEDKKRVAREVKILLLGASHLPRHDNAKLIDILRRRR